MPVGGGDVGTWVLGSPWGRMGGSVPTIGRPRHGSCKQDHVGCSASRVPIGLLRRRQALSPQVFKRKTTFDQYTETLRNFADFKIRVGRFIKVRKNGFSFHYFAVCLDGKNCPRNLVSSSPGKPTHIYKFQTINKLFVGFD